MICTRKFLIKLHARKRFEETWPGRDVCVINTTSEQIEAGPRMRGMRLAESGTGRIWDHHTGLTQVLARIITCCNITNT